MVLPNLFIPGAQKSGTTTLVKMLELHSDFYAGDEKEPHFFSKDRKYSNGLDYYKSYYANYKDQSFIIDGSQSYMPLDFVPKRIYEALGHRILFIFVLRNPVDRAVSAFTHFKIQPYGEHKRNLLDIIPKILDGISLEELLEVEAKTVTEMLATGILQSRNETWARYGFPFTYFYGSCYSRHIARYFQYFPRQNFLFLTFEEVAKEQEKVLHKVARFLKINPATIQIDSRIHANPSLEYRNRLFSLLSPIKQALKPMLPNNISNPFRNLERKWLMKKPDHHFSEVTYQQLLTIFQPEIDRVEGLTGLDLSAWKIRK